MNQTHAKRRHSLHSLNKPISFFLSVVMLLSSITTAQALGREENYSIRLDEKTVAQSAPTPQKLTGLTYSYEEKTAVGLNHSAGGAKSTDDAIRLKLTDGVKSINGSIALDDAAVIYTNDDPPNAGGYTRYPSIDFDLGAAKSVTSISIFSSKAVQGEGPMGRVAYYQIFISNDGTDWAPLTLEPGNDDANDCRDKISPETGGYVATYNPAADKNPMNITEIDSIYARYFRVLLRSNAWWGNDGYLPLEEIEFMGTDEKTAKAYDPFSPVEKDDLLTVKSYTYEEKTAAGLNHTAGGAKSPDDAKTKLTDGLKSVGGNIDLKDVALLYTDNRASGSPYTNFPTIDFDLGSAKSVTSISIYSPKAIGEWSTPGHIGYYQIYASADGIEWVTLTTSIGGNEDKYRPDVPCAETGGFVTTYSIHDEGVQGHADADSIYARYFRVTLRPIYWWAQDGIDYERLCLEEVEFAGTDEKTANAYDPSGSAGETDPNYPNNIAYRKKYVMLNNEANLGGYPDPDLTKLTDGLEGNKYNDGNWVGLASGSYREIVIDLQKLSSVAGVEFNSMSDDGTGIYLPWQVDLAFSADNVKWSSLQSAFQIPEAPKVPGSVRISWDSTADAMVTKKEGYTTSKVTARYVKLHIPMAYWFFIDEIRVLGEVGVTGDAVTLLSDDDDSRTYMQTGPQTAGISNLMLFYNGHYDDGAGSWSTEDFAPYLVYEDRASGKVDSMFDGALLLALKTEGGKHDFQGAASAADAATIDDYIWYLEKTLGEDGDAAHLNEAAKLAAEKLGNPNYKLKVVLSIPKPDDVQISFGALPGTKKGLCFSAKLNPDWQQDQLAALNWYCAQLVERWKAAGFDYLDWAGVYLLQEEISTMTPCLSRVPAFAKENNLKYFWIPYNGAKGYAQWKRWGVDAVAYQPNYMFNGNAEGLTNAIGSAKFYGMGMELELDGVDANGAIPAKKFNRYMDYLDSGVDYGFDGNKSFRAYYQGVRALSYAALSSSPKSRYIYDATYRFIKGTYQKGYLQYLTKDNISLNDIPDIMDVMEGIETKLKDAKGDALAFLNSEKAKLNALQSYALGLKAEITALLGSFEGVTANTITAAQKVLLKTTVERVRTLLNGQNLTGIQRTDLERKLRVLCTLDPQAYPSYTVKASTLRNGTVQLDKVSAVEGETVTVKVIPDSGFRLKEGTLRFNSTAISGSSFTMPAKNVVVSAEFEPLDQTSYTISVGTLQNGIIKADRVSAKAGETVTLTVSPGSGYRMVNGTLRYNTTFIEGNSFTMPAKNVILFASFESTRSGSTSSGSGSSGSSFAPTTQPDVYTKLEPEKAIYDIASGKPVSLAKPEIITPDLFKIAQALGKHMVFNVVDKDGKTQYQWEFTGADMKYPQLSVSLGMNIAKPDAKNAATIFPALPQGDALLVQFSHFGVLPGKANVKIAVSGTYANGDKVSLYRTDVITKAVTLVAKDLVVKDGFVSLSLDYAEPMALVKSN